MLVSIKNRNKNKWNKSDRFAEHSQDVWIYDTQ